VRILAVDPGLTRCGVGVVDLGQGRRVSFVDVFVVQTPPSAALSDRLFALHTAIDEAIARHAPKRIALERVFAQHNLRTVMGTAQASGVVLALAGARGLPVALAHAQRGQGRCFGQRSSKQGPGGRCRPSDSEA
jgi:crossover junction endodeoxyribonuclease RuvC